MDRVIVAVMGPTAVGKTSAAIEIAKKINGEIVSCDSMQLYKYMDIGSAKPTEEEQALAKHHLVDCVDPREPFSVAMYRDLAKNAIEQLFAEGKRPVIAGGTGLYLNSLIYDMDFAARPANDGTRAALYAMEEDEPGRLHEILTELDHEAAERIHPNNTKKLVRAVEAAMSGERVMDFSKDLKRTADYGIILIGLERDRAELYDRIDRRVDILMEQGLADEVKRLMAMGLTASDISMKGIGYKELIDHFNGEYDMEEAVRLIKRNTRHYAKRQMTWFRRYKDAVWFNLSAYTDQNEAFAEIVSFVKGKLEHCD